MKYVQPFKLKVLMIMFFATGILGVVVGLTIAPQNTLVMITFMGVINLGLGAFFGWVFLTQRPAPQDPRKRKPKKK